MWNIEDAASDRWWDALGAVLDRISSRFARYEPRRHAGRLMLGCCPGWTARTVGPSPSTAGSAADGLQHLQARAVWDADGWAITRAGYLSEHCADLGRGPGGAASSAVAFMSSATCWSAHGVDLGDGRRGQLLGQRRVERARRGGGGLVIAGTSSHRQVGGAWQDHDEVTRPLGWPGDQLAQPIRGVEWSGPPPVPLPHGAPPYGCG